MPTQANLKVWLRERTWSDHRRTQSGVVLVEAAIVALFLLVISGGILEYASLFASTNDAAGAVRSAARAGAITTPSGTIGSDYQIIQGLISRSGGPRTNITRLVIYRANATSSGPPAACKTGTGASCDVYTGSQLSLSEAQIDALPGSQRQWPESARHAGQDYVGVWVSVSRPKVFGNLIPAPSSYTDNFDMLISPKPTTTATAGWSPGALSVPNPTMAWHGTQPWPADWWCDDQSCQDASGDAGGGSTGLGGGGGGGS